MPTKKGASSGAKKSTKTTTKSTETKKKVETKVDTSKRAQSERELRKEMDKKFHNYKKEKLVEVYGNSMYKGILPDPFTYMFNGDSVVLYLNDTHQKFPESVAKNLTAKLKKVTKNNRATETNEQIF